MSSQDYGLGSHTTHMVCVNFICEWRELQFNVASEWQIFEKLFRGRFIYCLSFWQKSAKRKYFVLMPGSGQVSPGSFSKSSLSSDTPQRFRFISIRIGKLNDHEQCVWWTNILIQIFRISFQVPSGTTECILLIPMSFQMNHTIYNRGLLLYNINFQIVQYITEIFHIAIILKKD